MGLLSIESKDDILGIQVMRKEDFLTLATYDLLCKYDLRPEGLWLGTTDLTCIWPATWPAHTTEITIVKFGFKMCASL